MQAAADAAPSGMVSILGLERVEVEALFTVTDLMRIHNTRVGSQ